VQNSRCPWPCFYQHHGSPGCGPSPSCCRALEPAGIHASIAEQFKMQSQVLQSLRNTSSFKHDARCKKTHHHKPKKQIHLRYLHKIPDIIKSIRYLVPYLEDLVLIGVIYSGSRGASDGKERPCSTPRAHTFRTSRRISWRPLKIGIR